jgi:radical SAM protein with 4Fe4S-binding SPASM domain
MSTIPINKGQFTLESPEREAAFERRRGHGCESSYAENRRLWTELPQQQQVSPFPLHVDLELASICNLRCPMCYTISDGFREKVNAKLMDFELFTRLADECAREGAYSLRLSYRGESFLHPQIVEAVRYAKKAGIKEVSSLTNAERLDEPMFQEIMEAGLDWLTVSIDGVGKTYEEIRRPAKFARLVEKLANFRRLRDEAGRAKPALKVQGILPAIAMDPEGYYETFRGIADLVSANPLIDYMQDKSKLPKIADFVCPQIYQRLTVGADGLVMMCANDESGDMVVGDASKESLKSIWRGEAMTRVRALHAEHRAAFELPPCKTCNLPLEVEETEILVGGRSVIAQTYCGGAGSLAGLNTPDRWKRKELGQ